MGLTIGVDLGGTKVAAAVVDEAGTILGRTRTETPSTGADPTIDAILSGVKELRSQHPEVEAVCVAAPGFIDAARATVLFLTNLMGWRHRPPVTAFSKGGRRGGRQPPAHHFALSMGGSCR